MVFFQLDYKIFIKKAREKTLKQKQEPIFFLSCIFNTVETNERVYDIINN